MTYHDNQGFQTTLVSECQPGTLILTSGGRLARHLKHKYRESQVAKGKTGWASPDILSLNAWMRKAWNMTWPSTRPLSRVDCLHLWKGACSRVPPPQPFLPDYKSFKVLDETYTVLARHDLSFEAAKAPSTPLLSWRREIMRTFDALAMRLNRFHPAFLPLHLAEEIRKGTVWLPEAIVLAAFEAPAPVEEKLFDSLASLCTVRRLDMPTGAPGKIERLVMPSRKQEVAWLTRQLVIDAQTIPLNRIGVVVPDTETYVPYIKQAFGEIMGKPVDQARSAYNISLGTPLLERPLVQSGLLPLRFWVEGQPRCVLLSLILSAYYDHLGRDRDRAARADRTWRKQGLDAGLRSLLHVLSDRTASKPEALGAGQTSELFPRLNDGYSAFQEALVSFIQKPERTGSEWARTLEAFWGVVGFPVISDEADAGAWRHLRKLLHGIHADLEGISMSLGEFTGLFRHLLSEELVHIRGSEEAGIQVLGIIESRGLSFEKLYVLGLSAGSLPGAVRPLPFLDMWERGHVQGATAGSQYTFAERAFRHLLACAPHVTLIRPEEESAEPLAASPFWAQVIAEERHGVIDVWNDPDSVWTRATWLQQARKGLRKPAAFPPVDPPVKNLPLPETVSVSQLSIAFACPFRFYAETILKVFPLDDLIVGISPLERGSRLHKALACFTRRCRNQGLNREEDKEAMETLLKACSDDALSFHADKAGRTGKNALGLHSRTMEYRRWVGENDRSTGLLMQWLELELQRLDEGWFWQSEESSFDGLTAPSWPFSVSGRVDRIDRHSDKGVMLWDYKSGEHPSGRDVLEYLIDPQIPAYVLAAKENRIAGLGKELAPNTNVSGGYIALKGASSVTHRALTPKGKGWDQVLEQWKESVARLGKKLVSGQFGAEPHPVSDGVREERACQYCPYRPLCGKGTLTYDV
jgi:probable DNA repair protein